MRKLLSNTLLVAMMICVSGFAMAEDEETCKCTNTRSVSAQLNRKMEKVAANQAVPDGSVVLKYTIEDDKLTIQDIQSSDPALKEIVMSTLNGYKLKMNGDQCREGYVRINFVDTNQPSDTYMIY